MFSVLENPWYEETIKYKITKENIVIIKDYLKFKKAQEEKAFKEYKASERYKMAVSDGYVILALPHGNKKKSQKYV